MTKFMKNMENDLLELNIQELGLCNFFLRVNLDDIEDDNLWELIEKLKAVKNKLSGYLSSNGVEI